MNKKQQIENDEWFSRQGDFLRKINYSGSVDVVDDVMGKIEGRKFSHRLHFRISQLLHFDPKKRIGTGTRR